MIAGRFVALDRDGTLIAERHYLSDPDGVELLPGAAQGLRRVRTLGYGLVVVTNQSAVARGLVTEARLDAIHDRLRALLALDGVVLDGVFVCPHHPDDGCACRKPRAGLIRAARRSVGLDPAASIVIGDKRCDVDLGRVVGATTILVRTGYGAREQHDPETRPDHVTDDLATAAELAASSLLRHL